MPAEQRTMLAEKLMNEAVRHAHDQACGHLAIVHLDATGCLHVGFILEDGDVECYFPQVPSSNVKASGIPYGSLDDVCLFTYDGKLGIKRRTMACIGKERCWESEPERIIPLVPQSRKCNFSIPVIPSTMNKAPEPEDIPALMCGLTQRSVIASRKLETAKEIHHIVRHNDHVDDVVRTSNDAAVWHCHDPAAISCRNAILARPEAEINESKVTSLPGLATWNNLFIIPDQSIVSHVFVEKGLCCKKESPKIQDIMSRVSLKFGKHFKTDIDPERKTIALWHGRDLEEPIKWMTTLIEELSAAGFKCKVTTIGGEKVMRADMEVRVPEGATHESMTVKKAEKLLFGVSTVCAFTSLSTPGHFLLYLAKGPAGLSCQPVKAAFVAAKINVRFISLGESKIGESIIELNNGVELSQTIQSVLDPLLEIHSDKSCLVTHRFWAEQGCLTIAAPEEQLEDTTKAVLEALQTIREVKITEVNGFAFCGCPDAVVTNACCSSNECSMTGNELGDITAETALLPASNNDSRLARSVLSIEGMCCQTEVPAVMAILKEFPEVVNVNISTVAKQVVLIHPATTSIDLPSNVAKALSNNGFPSHVVSSPGKPKIKEANEVQQASRRQFWGIQWNVMLATVLWLISWLSYVKQPQGMVNLKYLSVVAIALTIPTIALKGLRSLRRGIMDINILMSLAVIGALAIQDFHEGAAVTVIFSWSNWLESRASSRARNALVRLMELKPEIARNEEAEEIPVESVVVDQVLMVLSGEKIPVDGDLLSAFCEVDESNLTGEARPVMKSLGDKLNAGTMLVSNSSIKMRCTAVAEDSAVARMVRLVEEASQSRSPVEQIVNKIAKVYTPIIVLIAVCMISFPWIVSASTGEFWLRTGLTLLVVACPCSLVISTPLTYVCAIAKAAKFGVLIKGGKYLETLTAVRALACDKTGTITMGQFEVVSCYENKTWMATSPSARTQAYALLIDIERHSVHPVARAIERYAMSIPGSEGSVSPKVETVEIIPGKGVKTVTADGSLVYLVKSEAANDFVRNPLDAGAVMWTEERMRLGDTISWLIIDGEAVLGLAACDSIRPEAETAIDELLDMGISIVALTGDNTGAGLILHQKLPQLTAVHASLTPQGKVDYITSLKHTGKKTQKVAMLGDGVNDAPALSASDVGIAMGVGGAPLALETADCALMDNDLLKVPRLFQHAAHTKRVLIQNIAFSLILKFIMLGLTIAGLVTLGIAIAVDVGSMLLVTLNAISLLREPWHSKSNRTNVEATAPVQGPLHPASQAAIEPV